MFVFGVILAILSCIWTEYGEIWSISPYSVRRVSPYSVRMRENADQNNFEYGHFSSSEVDKKTYNFPRFIINPLSLWSCWQRHRELQREEPPVDTHVGTALKIKLDELSENLTQNSF